jgi:WD40 repeat protein
VKPEDDPSHGDQAEGKARERTSEPLGPLVSAAMEPEPLTLAERLARLEKLGRSGAHYTPLGEVARGGMGRILRVWDPSLAREVAMKVVPREAQPGSSDEQRNDHDRRLARFLDEARLSAQLDHPGIVPVYEIGLDETGSVYFTMPLVRGRTLEEVFAGAHAGEEPTGLHEVIEILHRVCQTVAFAHAKGIVHRDLKPANIMVGRFGETYVMDWGLALLLGRVERPAVVGTPAYMAPEQARGRGADVGPRADVYSLGAILYEFFARRRPHELSMETRRARGESVDEVLVSPPRPLRELRTTAPPELASICARAMAARPEERYASAEELAADLAAWLAGRVVTAHPTGRLERLKKWRRRNQGLALALDALGLLAIAGSIAFLRQQRLFLGRVEAQHRTAVHAAYAAGLSAADMGLRVHETGEARRRLAECAPEMRGWEWRHLELRADESVGAIEGGVDRGVRAVAVAPDGALLAIGADDGSIRLWRPDQGLEVRQLEGHTHPVNALAFAPDGRTLCSGAQDESVRLWDVSTGSETVRLTDHDTHVSAVAYHRDEPLFATGDGHGVLVLRDAADGRPRWVRPPDDAGDGIVGLDFVPGTPWIAVAYVSAELALWNLHGDCVRRAPFDTKTPHALAVDPEGTRLALALGSGAVQLLDSATLEPLESAAIALKASALAFAPGGRQLAVGGYDELLRVVDLDEGEVRELAGHDGDLFSVAYFPGGRRLVTGSDDGSARLWDIERVPIQVLEGSTNWVESVAFAPDGRTLASGSRDGRLRLFDVATGTPVSTRDTGGFVTCLGWSRTGRLAYGGRDEHPRVLDPQEAGLGTILPGGQGYPQRLTFDLAGEHVLWIDSANRVHAADLATQTHLFEIPVEDTSDPALAIAPDGRTFAVGHRDGRVSLHDARTGERLRTLQGDPSGITALAFDPQGTVLAAGRRNTTIVLFELASGEVLQVLNGHTKLVTCVAFSPDGQRLVSGALDHTLRLWTPDRPDALLTLHGHTDGVTAVDFSPDGDVLASSAKDRTVRLWRATPLPASND